MKSPHLLVESCFTISGTAKSPRARERGAVDHQHAHPNVAAPWDKGMGVPAAGNPPVDGCPIDVFGFTARISSPIDSLGDFHGFPTFVGLMIYSRVTTTVSFEAWL